MKYRLRMRLLQNVMVVSTFVLWGCAGGDTAGTTDIPADAPGTDGGMDVLEGDSVEQDSGQIDLVLADGMICAPGDTQCFGSNFLECSTDGMDWISTPCEAGASCTPEGCMETECVPNERACDENGKAVICLPDGSGWGAPTECEEGWFCAGGQCVEEACLDGEKKCAGSILLLCTDGSWTENPCGEGWICFKEQCVECFADSQCPKGMSCIDGICTIAPLEVLTTELPDGQVGVGYSAALQAQGGGGNYNWSVSSGALPPGIDLNANGSISGTPDAKGEYPFTGKVEDGGGATASRDLSITIHDTGLVILSKSPLPNATEGEGYSFQFEASGGITPYGWMVLSGALPSGLNLFSDGMLQGTPTNAHGMFDFQIRAVDAGFPIAAAAKDFQLMVEVAPLEIIADTIIDLFLTKVVILPLITIIEGIPIPYNTQLQAKGGIKPYHWAESELSGLISGFIPKAGIPDGLTLADDGTLSGSVTDTSLVFELNIPFLNYALKGFFFMAEVRDSQDPQDSATAIFLIPTVPIDFGGLGL